MHYKHVQYICQNYTSAKTTQHGAQLCPHHSDRLGRYAEFCLAGQAISTGHCAFLTPYESWYVLFP